MERGGRFELPYADMGRLPSHSAIPAYMMEQGERIELPWTGLLPVA